MRLIGLICQPVCKRDRVVMADDAYRVFVSLNEPWIPPVAFRVEFPFDPIPHLPTATHLRVRFIIRTGNEFRKLPASYGMDPNVKTVAERDFVQNFIIAAIFLCDGTAHHECPRRTVCESHRLAAG